MARIVVWVCHGLKGKLLALSYGYNESSCDHSEVGLELRKQNVGSIDTLNYL